MTALVFVHPDRETLVVSGPDRVSWLNGLLTCDINEVSSRHGVFGLALSRTGKIHTDVWVLAAPDRLFLAVAAGTSISVHNELNKMLIMEDAELSWKPRRTAGFPCTASNPNRLSPAQQRLPHSWKRALWARSI